MGLPKTPETERTRRTIADLYHAAALAAWDGCLDEARAHVRLADALLAGLADPAAKASSDPPVLPKRTAGAWVTTLLVVALVLGAVWLGRCAPTPVVQQTAKDAPGGPISPLHAPR